MKSLCSLQRRCFSSLRSKEAPSSSKFTFLKSDSSFQSFSQAMHPDLQEALHKNNFIHPTQIQQQVLEAGILDNKSMVINSETGSGKTLAYLLPVINQLLKFKDTQKVPAQGARFHMTKETEGQMFQNAEEIIYHARKNKRLSFNSTEHSQPKGALILSSSKEVLNQVYCQARKLDVKQRLLINRATSSLQMKTPIVEFITPDKDKGEKEMSQDQLFEISLTNVINNASWRLTDVLVASPVVMSHILDHKEKFDPYDINPAIIVIDEFDEVLSMQNLSSNLLSILRKFASFQPDKNNPIASLNRSRQFLFAGATLPSKMLNGSDCLETLIDWIPDISHQKSDRCHKVSPSVEHEWLHVDAIPESSKLGGDPEINCLVEVIKRSLGVQRHQQIMVFAESKKTIDKICEVLRAAEIKNLPYYSDIGVQGKNLSLQLFASKQLPVLVSSSIGQRGLDTMNVDHVVLFDFPKNAIDYLHQVGRTGRMGQPGYVTSFIRKGDQDLEEAIREHLEGDEPLTKLLKKKKGVKKTIKRKGELMDEEGEDE